MKNLLFILSIIALGTIQVYAQQVSLEEAEQVAQHFFGKAHKSMQNGVTVSVDGQDTLLYVFNGDHSFVVVSGEKKAIPILAYSTESNYAAEDVIPPVQMWLNTYRQQLLALRKNETLQQSISVDKAWKEWQTPFKQHKNTTSPPTIPLTTSKWGQGKPYNFYCPQDVEGTNNRAVTGCVATAMAQIMYYFRYPQTGIDTNAYFHDTYGVLSADFSQATYNYQAMVDKPKDINLASSLLISHCGIAVEMNYGPKASAAFSHVAADALKNHFGYSPETQLVSRWSVSNWDSWDSLIVAHLDKKIPLYYSGTDPVEYLGHAFVCDAYQVDSMGNYYYHFNFGWEGYQDGYFYTNPLLDTILSDGKLTYYWGQDIIINAYPDTVNFHYPPTLPLTGTSILTEETGSFTDGTIYDCPPNMDYTWIIRPDVDDITQIKFSIQYQLAEDDTIFITSKNGNLNTVFTHDTSTFSETVTDTEITVRLKTTNELTASGGFSADYITTGKTYCRGGIDNHYSKKDTFGDGSGESRYNNFAYCRYRIIVDGATSITIRFTKFETEKDKDVLSIYNNIGSSPLLMSLSGIHTDSVYTFNTNRILFIFETDEQNIAQGWELTYKTDLPDDTVNTNQVDKNREHPFSIYPNPASNVLCVTVDDLSQKGQIQIFDIYGRLLIVQDIKEEVSQVNVNTLATGMYIVKIMDGDKVRKTKRIIKE